MYKKDKDVFRWEWLDKLTNPDQTQYPQKREIFQQESYSENKQNICFQTIFSHQPEQIKNKRWITNSQ